MKLNPLTIVAAAVCVVSVGGFTLFKAYEHRATRGVGFVEASEISIDDTTSVRTKKQIFFDTMRPIVEAENARILDLRERLIEARTSGTAQKWVAEVAEDYRVDWTGEEWTALLKRVDAVPLTLALAQSANESSWGQSRFAQRGNNMFGQWCFSKGCGLVPQQRTEGKTHEVASYNSINESVRSYIKNINTTGAYKPLREIRWQARQAGERPRAVRLAEGLRRYSERGQAYVEEIRSMIRINRTLMLGETETAANT